MLYSRSLLVIYFIYSNVIFKMLIISRTYIEATINQFLPETFESKLLTGCPYYTLKLDCTPNK